MVGCTALHSNSFPFLLFLCVTAEMDTYCEIVVNIHLFGFSQLLSGSDIHENEGKCSNPARYVISDRDVLMINCCAVHKRVHPACRCRMSAKRKSACTVAARCKACAPAPPSRPKQCPCDARAVFFRLACQRLPVNVCVQQPVYATTAPLHCHGQIGLDRGPANCLEISRCLQLP